MTTRAPAHRQDRAHLKILINAADRCCDRVLVAVAYRYEKPEFLIDSIMRARADLLAAIALARRYTLTPRRSRPAGPKAGREQAGK